MLPAESFWPGLKLLLCEKPLVELVAASFQMMSPEEGSACAIKDCMGGMQFESTREVVADDAGAGGAEPGKVPLLNWAVRVVSVVSAGCVLPVLRASRL